MPPSGPLHCSHGGRSLNLTIVCACHRPLQPYSRPYLPGLISLIGGLIIVATGATWMRRSYYWVGGPFAQHFVFVSFAP